MFKAIRLLALFVLLIVLTVPLPAHATPPTCNAALFSAAATVGRLGTRLSSVHWQNIDPPYITDFWRMDGKNLSIGIQVKRHNRLLAVAYQTNAGAPVWQVCDPGNGWKNYVLMTAQQP